MQLHTSTKEQGAVSIIGVGFLLIMILVASFALDALEIMSTKSRLALAINNVISTVYSLPESQWVPAATRLLNSHFPESDISVTAMVTKTSNGCALSASASVPSLFIHKFSNSAAYSVTERVKLVSNPSATLPKREIALAVDVSSSMNDGYFNDNDGRGDKNSGLKKLIHQRKAVLALLKKADEDSDFQNRIRISLVPFSGAVNIGQNRPWVIGGDPQGECAQTRVNSKGNQKDSAWNNIDAIMTTKRALSSPLSAQIKYYKYVKHEPYYVPFCHSSPLIPLTTNLSKLSKK